ncbi:hypothetical protein M409DRAFT_30232 [Zasmidium cellare ATCC 36951]|uniref:RanBD1 domain-containing protein n=1 Tax=Zasmidium cellare ATCC 36951 TaxID=1080233 RepID=A0A6A6BWZ3_ZASCE|nr:uncharacterized protein M409DRAFT_30232 [Zasmidium cellare ATCC 36951]KAF2159354.1 hypothetical protein M409DRAFT_30232 [Zasmidium cellare ATCC 36951]
MTSEKNNGPLSDTEGGEKPVREQLKKAHITSEAAKAAVNTAHEAEDGGNTISGEERGRLHRKRSHEEVEGDSQDATSVPPKQHTRKRSRDSTAEEDEINNGQRKVSGERARNGDELVPAQAPEPNGADREARATTPEGNGEKRPEEAVESMTSPKTKRSRLHSTIADDKDLVEADKAADAVESHKEDESKEDESSKQPSTKKPATSGFANTSSTPHFGALTGSKSTSEQQQTSASAFAASGFSALAGSSGSGFGAVGKQSGGFGSGGSFATGAKSPLNTKEDDKPSAPSGSSFGGALGQQSAFSASAASGGGFGSGASGFGKLGSQSTGGFGSGLGGTGFSRLGGGGGLSSFASGKTASPLGGISKSTKPFGAPAEEEGKGEDDDSDDKTGAKSPLATEEDEQDERFYEQELETGEEDESTEFSSRAKLYTFAADQREWRERGFGVVRLNVRRLQPDEDQKPKARLLMRAEGSHRVVLNTPVTKEIKYGTHEGKKPTGGYFYFMGTIDGKPGLEVLQLKMRQENTLELYEHICKLLDDM